MSGELRWSIARWQREIASLKSLSCRVKFSAALTNLCADDALKVIEEL